MADERQNRVAGGTAIETDLLPVQENQAPLERL
jgi:hypothetical protein